jgi:DNA-binding response OmpR family regulator
VRSHPSLGALGSLLCRRFPDLLASEYNNTVHASILVVEDEEKLAQAIALYLRNAGFSVEIALDGQAALEAFARHQPDLIVLDLMLPKIDGWTVCHKIRQSSDVPIIMLTARVGEPARVQGLELGADDYLEKPFSLRELVARIHAVLRRAGKKHQPVIHAGDLRIDLEQHEVFVREKKSRADRKRVCAAGVHGPAPKSRLHKNSIARCYPRLNV